MVVVVSGYIICLILYVGVTVAHTGSHVSGADHGKIIFRISGGNAVRQRYTDIITQKADTCPLIDIDRNNFQIIGLGEKQIRSSFDGRGKDAAKLSNSVRISDIQDQHFRGSAGQSPGNIRNYFCWQVLDFTVFVKVIIVMLGQHFSIRVSLNVDSKVGSIIEAKPHEICRERAEEN